MRRPNRNFAGNAARVLRDEMTCAVSALCGCAVTAIARALQIGTERNSPIRECNRRSSTCRLEQLYRVAVGIFDLNLLATRASLHRVAEVDPRVLERLDVRG